jgi:hypothetical protein
VTEATGPLDETGVAWNASGSWTSQAVSNCYSPNGTAGSGTEVFQGGTTPGTMGVYSLDSGKGADGKPDLEVSYYAGDSVEHTEVTQTGDCPGSFAFIEGTASDDISAVNTALGIDDSVDEWTINRD